MRDHMISHKFFLDYSSEELIIEMIMNFKFFLIGSVFFINLL